MSIQRLEASVHTKPWGRPASTLDWLPALNGWSGSVNERVGEVWFLEPGAALESQGLLMKILSTGEPLSVQVHPGDELASEWALPGGKHEAWVVLEAEPQASVALGLREPIQRSQLKRLVLEGVLAEHLYWHPVQAGDVIDVPPGTIHAIGGGLTLLEIQQPVDATFRLFDYARGRELHLEEGCLASRPVPYTRPITRLNDPRRQVTLCDSGPFSILAWSWVGRRCVSVPSGQSIWVVPVSGSCKVNGQRLAHLSCWKLQGECEVDLADDAVLIAAHLGRGDGCTVGSC